MSQASDSSPSHDSALSKERRQELDEFCIAFESAWVEDPRSRISIATFAQGADEELKPYVVRELVAVECEFRARLGESPTLDEYLVLLPAFHVEVTLGWGLWQTTARESDVMAGSTPDQIGDFRVLREIGRGGMGVLYEARQESLGRNVAIKMLLAGPLLRPERARRFEREARAVAKLHHANIVDVYGTGIHEGVPYFAMEFIDGISLRDLVRRARTADDSPTNGKVPISLDSEKDIARVGLQVSSALSFAHSQGILHRDIKPSNLIVDDVGDIWVTDFGLAKLAEDQGDTTRTGDVIGTLRYLPPEALKGNWDERGDVYSLGMTLYELLALEPAYPESRPFELLERIRQGVPLPRPSERRPVSGDLETIVMKAVAFEPGTRYQSAGLLAEDLQRFLNGEPILARQSSGLERLAKWSRRKPALAAFCALATTVVFIGLPLLSFLWQRSERALADATSMQEQLTAARDVAEISEELAITESYASSMQLAHTYLDQARVLEVESILCSWDPEFDGNTLGLASSAQTKLRAIDRRGWEWRYLQNQLDTSRLTMTGHSTPYIHFAAVRPDDQQIATVGGSAVLPMAQVSPGEVILWDAKTGEQEMVLPGSHSGVFGCAYSPDGSQIATISMRREGSHGLPGEIKIWDVESGKLLNTAKLPGTHDEQMHSFFDKPVLPGLRYSSDGEYLISWPIPVEVRNAETLELIWSDELAHCAIDLPNDRLFLSSRKDGDQIVDIRNGEVHKKQRVARGRPVRFDVAVTTTGDQVSASGRSSLVVWNIAPLKPRSYSIEGMRLHWGAIHPTGNMLIAADRLGVLQLVGLTKNGSAGTVTRRLGHASVINHGTFSHNGKWMVTTSSDGTAKVWDIDGDRHKAVIGTLANAASIADLTFSGDSARIQYASRRNTNPQAKRSKYLTGWHSLRDTGDVPPRQKFNLSATYYAHWPRTDFAFSPDGQFLAAPAVEDERPEPSAVVGFAKSGRVNIWRSRDYDLQGGFDVGLDAITSIQWSDDSAWLAVAGTMAAEAFVRIYPTERCRTADTARLQDAGKSEEALEPACEFNVGQPVGAISWHGPTSTTNYLTGNASGKALAADTVLPEPAANALPLTLQLATANQDGVTVWDFKKEGDRLTATKRSEFPDEGVITFLDFSPDGTQLAAAIGDQSTARVYDVTKGVLEYEVPGPRAIGCVRYSPDGTRLAMTGYDSVVFLCDPTSGRMLLQLSGSERPPGTISINPRVVFSSDGRRIATNNWRGEITVWDAGPAAQD